MKIDKCEADDIVAVLTKDHSEKKDDITIISSDHDFNQLLTYFNVKQYDPIKRKNIECINPKLILETNILTGCSSDNIKPIRKGIGPKTAAKLLNEGLEELLKDEQLLNNYKRNKKLIDFTEIPSELQESIRNKYIEKQKELPEKLDTKKVVDFLFKNRIRKITEDFEQFKNYLINLN
jgi:5'-3' exonuclease